MKYSVIIMRMFQDSAPDQGDSEYESADDDIEILEGNLPGENGSGEEPYPEPGSERQEGDGEETPSSPTLDDDEDKKNPAYIPKRGMFYEHDDRIDPADEMEEEEEEEKEKEKEEREKKKKAWKADGGERWGHDKFMEMEQTPKNQDELVAAYGYDIRNEDAAPRARRRRRYGRGPNKYTRSWKDEDAYVKPPAAPVKAKPVPVGSVPIKPGGKAGKNVTIAAEADESREEEEGPHPLMREKSMTEMKSSHRPAMKREKSAPEFRTNNRGGPPHRNSRDREEDNFRNNRRSDGFYSKGSESFGFGPRGHHGPPRGRGGRGGRGGYDDHFRGGGRNMRGGFDDRNRGGFEDRNRGGYEDRSRGGFDERGRGERKGRDSYQQGDSRVNPDFRGSGRGRGRGGRGGREDREDKRQTEAGANNVKPEDLAEEVNSLVLKESEGGGGGGGGGGKGPMRYSQQRRAGSGVSDNNSASSSLQEMYAEGIDPSLCSGPPSAPPFQNQQMSAGRLGRDGREGREGSHPSVTQSNMAAGNFIGANQAILNYSPQFPVGPVVTPSSLGIAGPVVTSGLPLNALASTILPGADPLMIQDNFADVRGGVTYFNPTAQNFLPQRQVTKRAKAPIAIVDPSQKSDAAEPSLPGESFTSDTPELAAA